MHFLKCIASHRAFCTYAVPNGHCPVPMSHCGVDCGCGVLVFSAGVALQFESKSAILVV